MNDQLILTLVLLLVAAVMAVSAVFCLMAYGSFRKKARRGQAKVVGIPPSMDSGALAPATVEMMVDGQKVVCRTQPCRFSYVAARIGQMVDVAYTEKKVLGQRMWKVFIMERPDRKIGQAYVWIAGLFGLMAVVMAGICFIIQ